MSNNLKSNRSRSEQVVMQNVTRKTGTIAGRVIVEGNCGVVRHDELQKMTPKCFVHEDVEDFSSLLYLTDEVTSVNPKIDRRSSVLLCPVSKKEQAQK
jgi:hypothetical protein